MIICVVKSKNRSAAEYVAESGLTNDKVFNPNNPNGEHNMVYSGSASENGLKQK